MPYTPKIWTLDDDITETDLDHIEVGVGDATELIESFLIESVMPVGAISQYAGDTAPDGWLVCDGVAVSRTTYADLFAIIGTDYGVGDGSTTFNLPDARSRVIVGVQPTDADFASLGKTGGEAGHVLLEDEMPIHTHIQTGHTHTFTDHSHDGVYADGLGYYKHGLNASTVLGSSTRIGAGGTLLASTGNPASADIYGTLTNDPAGTDTPHNNLQPYLTMNHIIKYTRGV